MDFLDLAKTRCSVRKYTTKKVENDKVNKLLEAAKVAPTAVNRQAQRLLVIESDEGLEKLSKACNHHNPTLAIIVCTDTEAVWTRKYDNKSMKDIDGAIVADHIVMMAESLGLGSCWLTLFYPDILKKEFNIPETYEPIVVLSIGYAEEKSSKDRHESERNSIESFVSYETY